MVVLNDNKVSPKNQAKTLGNDQVMDYQKVKLPMPREFNGKKYYGTEDVAKIIGVTRKTVWQWQTTLYFDCPLFTADERAHDGRFLYEVERVMQLKAVYHPNWTRGGYEPAPFDEKQKRITELVHFFNLLFGKITAPHFAYLNKFKGGTKFYPFAIADETQREAMAIKAIELSDKGVDVWHSVNPVNIEPTNSKRGDEFAVSYQTAVIVDIDIFSDAHKSDNLAANFNEANPFYISLPA